MQLVVALEEICNQIQFFFLPLVEVLVHSRSLQNSAENLYGVANSSWVHLFVCDVLSKLSHHNQ